MGLRILELLRVDPNTVSAHNMRVYRNHVIFLVFQRGRDGYFLVNERTSEVVTRTVVRRNPLPRSAWTTT